MPRRKRYSSPFEFIDDDFDEDNCSQSSRHGYPPVQRNAANARERARMRVLSSAFGRLKTKLPNIPADTKLSKLDTLRLATMYIKQLKAVVEGGDNANLNGDHINGAINRNANGFLSSHHTTQSMSWPFGFYHHHLQHHHHHQQQQQQQQENNNLQNDINLNTSSITSPSVNDSWLRDEENFKSRQIRLGSESYITHLQPNHENHNYTWHSENSSPSHLNLSHCHEPAYQFCHLNHPETHSLRNYEQHGSNDQNLRAFTNYNNLTDAR
uniref:BHLH domain-containing protein n=1 Tax=Glossina austeni TaxID=7395 RepID=A0A1A9VJ11_GLOAU